MLFRTANLSQLAQFDEIIDVRTPAEFADDHIPGAINCPVLSNAERVTVGTLYTQVSPFEARKVGAALVAKNIAHHIETRFHAQPKSWKPLVYCWRGGQRSGAMSIILAQIGWAAHKLEGGYKTWRRDVLDKLENLPDRFNYRVICGATGSGKTRLLEALAAEGAQVLDLEGLARHRGSVLGGIPLQDQPSPRWFDTTLVQTLQGFDPAQPVFVEAESNKIGRIALPLALVNATHGGECLLLDTAREARIALLLEDYRHFTEAPDTLIERLQPLRPFHGAKKMAHWEHLINGGDFAALVAELLALHYDPTYLRSLGQHFSGLQRAQLISLQDTSAEAMRGIARELLASLQKDSGTRGASAHSNS
ncbi:tRNA 2-selenouridine(34) synthase MnmH [Ferrigenium sp. UT5]|uniref:tRNA 2-selenouridine(34) synthase MnmH n=1 Tax=Ferrigenium sp. UT5 TaxID=3242105 RepID=UPI003553FAF6